MGNNVFHSFQERLVYIVGGLVAVLFVLMLSCTPTFMQVNSEHSSASVDPRSGSAYSGTDQVVNKNLREDQALLDLRAKAMASENQRMRETIDLNVQAADLLSDLEGLDPNVYDGSSEVYQDIYGETPVYDSHLNPKDRIEAKLRRLRLQTEYDFQQKLAFVREFVRNAYQAGFQVEVNDRLEVVGVSRVNPVDRFRGSASIEGLNNVAQ